MQTFSVSLTCECGVRKQLQKCLRPLSLRYGRQKPISLPVHQHTSTSTSTFRPSAQTQSNVAGLPTSAQIVTVLRYFRFCLTDKCRLVHIFIKAEYIRRASRQKVTLTLTLTLNVLLLLRFSYPYAIR